MNVNTYNDSISMMGKSKNLGCGLLKSSLSNGPEQHTP